MKRNINILVTATSRRVAMVKGFQSAIKDLGLSGSVHGTDTDRLSAGLRFCDKYHFVPLSSSPKYIPAILDICKKEKINIVVPTIDEELGLFGQHKADFEAIGVIALVSEKSVGAICNDKYLTAKFFKENNFPFAETYLPSQINFDSIKYPLFIKPRAGRGGVQAFPVLNETELRFFIEYVDDPVIQRFLEGVEYTVDVCAGLDGRILSVVPRERIVIRSGVCDRGRTVKDHKIIDISIGICEKLGVVGPVNLQCIKENGKITFFEINPRFSGAIQLTIASGADFFAMIIKEACGVKQGPTIGEFEEGLMMMSYEESLFESVIN